MAGLYRDHLNADIRKQMAGEWTQLEECWAARHVFTHCDGKVDAKYLAVVTSSPLRVGQRLQMPDNLTQLALTHTSSLVRALHAAT